MAAIKAKDSEVRFEPDVEISDQVKKLIEKKKRNVEKRKNKLEDYKKRAEKGEKLLPEQAEALSNYTGVLESLQTLQSLLDQIQQLYAQQARWLKKERKASLKKGSKQSKEMTTAETHAGTQEETLQSSSNEAPAATTPAVSPPPSFDANIVLPEALTKQAKIFRLLQCFGEESVRQRFLVATEENRSNLANLSELGLVSVNQTDLDWLDEAFGLLNPISDIPDANAVDVFGCSVSLTTKQINDILAPSCEQWAALLQRKEAAMLEDGTTYALVAELMDRLLDCQFFADWKPTHSENSSPTKAPCETPNIPASVPVTAESFTTPTPPPGFPVIPGSTVSHPSTVSAPINTNRYPSGGGVERMLQTLDTSYTFMQHPSTPTQENGAALHEASQIQPARASYQQPSQQPVSMPSYWGGSDINTNRALAMPNDNALAGSKSNMAGHSVAADWNSMEAFNSEPISDHYVPSSDSSVLAHQHHSHGSGETRERISSGVSSNTGVVVSSLAQVPVPSSDAPSSSIPPANLSWADKVRFNSSAGSMSTFPKPIGIENQVYSSGISQSQQPAGDVFTTASQSQFLSPDNGGENEGGYRRRGGGGRGRGFYGGDRGRGRDGYRGSGRGGMRGGYQNGQRGRGGFDRN